MAIGRYTIWVTLYKSNYESKQTIIFLTINEREIDYDLGDMFEEKQTSVVKGETITLSIELTDHTKGDIPLKGAQIILELGDDEFEFEEVEDGIYELEFKTEEYEAFYTSTTLTGTRWLAIVVSGSRTALRIRLANWNMPTSARTNSWHCAVS